MLDKDLINRDYYLNKLKSFKDTSYIKVITGIRRSGKSKLMHLMVEYLISIGVENNRIIEMNFESFKFKNMTSDDVYLYIKEFINNEEKYYIFLDEIQNISKWEDAVNALRVDFNCDIYLTGSNAYLLSSEYSTYLSGRCIEIKMLPLNFKEFLNFHGFELKKIQDDLGNNRNVIIKDSNREYSIDELFNAYLRYGGFPGLKERPLNEENVGLVLQDIYETVVTKDILNRPKNKNIKQIRDGVLLEKILKFLADSIGSNISTRKIGNTLQTEGMLDYRKDQGIPSAHTIQYYIDALKEAYLFYEVKRFDIRGNEYLKTLGKYYIVDLGLRNLLLGNRNRDLGHMIENVVYFELLSRGYNVAIGKINDLEIDFIATKNDKKIYFQVTLSLLGEGVMEREIKSLNLIKDNYEKIILCLEMPYQNNINGIKVIKLTDWLLDK